MINNVKSSFSPYDKKQFLLKIKKQWREQRNLKNFYKIELIFGFQCILFLCLFYSIVLMPAFNNVDGPPEQEFPYVIFVLKYICAMILHMTMQPKLYDAIERLYYIKSHPHKFDRITIPLIICMFKLLVELFTEAVSLALIAACDDCSAVVMNYIALGVISKIDEVYYDAIKTPLKE